MMPASDILSPPAIKGQHKFSGVELTRKSGVYKGDWTPVAWDWTMDDGTSLGNDESCWTSSVPPDAYVILQETVRNAEGWTATVSSEPFGPFMEPERML